MANKTKRPTQTCQTIPGESKTSGAVNMPPDNEGGNKGESVTLIALKYGVQLLATPWEPLRPSLVETAVYLGPGFGPDGEISVIGESAETLYLDDKSRRTIYRQRQQEELKRLQLEWNKIRDGFPPTLSLQMSDKLAEAIALHECDSDDTLDRAKKLEDEIVQIICRLENEAGWPQGEKGKEELMRDAESVEPTMHQTTTVTDSARKSGQKSGGKQKLPEVNLGLNQVRYDGVCHDVSPDGALFIDELVKAYPNAISASNLSSKPSRLKGSLPKKLQEIIVSEAAKGTKLVLPK